MADSKRQTATSKAKPGAKTTRAGKHPGGRPPKYTEAEAMAEKIDAYFEGLCGDGDKPDEPPTAAGLALALGFVDRQSLLDYEAKPEFSGLLKRARLRVQGYWERRLAGTAPTGAIFWLKNHAGYADRTEVDNNVHTDEGLTIVLSGVEAKK